MVIGSTISHYRIVEKLGEGGMGVVYKAEDTQLRRTVALKFLSRETLGEDEVKERLIREAQAAASLDHPNICAVHGIHEENGETFIAMAFVDGPSLAEKIKERPLPLDEALSIASQIAQGLNEAHEQGIVHRDVKPHNVMLTSKGQAKIMDFGLASLAGRSKLTKTGTTLGTPAYMSPEQLEGKDVDRRTDVWALGCVLYEVLTQKTPFDADYEQAIAYGILNEEPEPISAQRADVSPEIDRLIAKALAKDPALRYQHADDLLADLRGLDRGPQQTTPSGRPPAEKAVPRAASSRTLHSAAPAGSAAVSSREQALIALATALAIGFVGVLLLYLQAASRSPVEAPIRKFSFTVEEMREDPVISPDGKHIVYGVGSPPQRTLWLRSLSDETARELPGTEGARNPFWSPDSAFIGFGVLAPEFTLRRIPIDGGSPLTLCPLATQSGFAFDGGSWSPDGERIVFASGNNAGNLYEVAARGGEATRLFDDEVLAQRPHFLPSGDLVYSNRFQATGGAIEVLNRGTGGRREVAPGVRPFYSPAGYLLFSPPAPTETGIFALPFDLETLSAGGDPFPIAEFGSFPSASRDGALVYSDRRGASQSLLVRDRDGAVLEVLSEDARGLNSPAVSPDGARVGFAQAGSVWTHNLGTGITTKLSEGFRPSWGPDPGEISFWNGQDVVVQPADGRRGAAVLFSQLGIAQGIPSWSRDGRFVAYAAGDPAGGEGGLWVRELGEDRSVSDAATLLRTPFDEHHPAISPNGRFVAYVSNHSGRFEIYLRRFPTGDGQWQASANGGGQPRWSPDGRWIYFTEVGTRTLMRVPVTLGDEVTIGPAERVFELGDVSNPGAGMSYDVFPDNQRFVTVSREGPAEDTTEIRIIQNWYEEFRNREE